MKYAVIGLVGAALAVWLASYPFHRATVTDEGALKVDSALTLYYRIISEGGALGTERYEVFAEQQGDRRKIFDGSGATDFTLRKAGPNLILLRFCGGTVQYLSSIDTSDQRERVTVQPILRCKT